MSNTTSIPRYRSHKEVGAIKITGIEPQAPDGTIGILGELPTSGTVRFPVDSHWLAKHLPEVGGYLVSYDDGYTSYSPAKAFEEGYTPIDGEPVETTWLDRLTAEGMELEGRIDKLTDFIENSSTFAGLPDPDRDRLLRQRVAMQAYHGILVERLEAAAPAVEQEASDEPQGGTEPEI